MTTNSDHIPADLKGIDPWSSALTKEQKNRIIEEARINSEYFNKELVRKNKQE